MRQTSFGPVGLVIWGVVGLAQGAWAQPAPPPLVVEGPSNTAVGQGALEVNDRGHVNVAIGVLALASNDSGNGNTASGANALLYNVSGHDNTASGYIALASNTAGGANTASGAAALYYNTTGSFNTADGFSALHSNTTGNYNTALGPFAGRHATTGSHNVHLGALVAGTAADTNTIRIGLPYDAGSSIGQNQTFIAGIWGNQLSGTAAQVFIDANGQLGTGTPVAMLSGTATLVTPAAVQQQLQEQRAINTAQQAVNNEQQAMIADLRARLGQLEALIASGARRK